MLLGHHPRHL